jgi:hypothetical protein
VNEKNIKVSIMTTEDLKGFHRRQLERWPLAAANFAALDNVELKQFDVDGVTFTVQHNPARIASTGAKVDKKSISARPCFLCNANRPAEQIVCTDFPGYEILVNPYPIFPLHFTIPASVHTPQLISADGCRRFADMLAMARALPGMALFYNGPHCGASAPDHFHFQAVEVSRLPIFDWLRNATVIPFRVDSVTYPTNTCSDAVVQWLADQLATYANFPENVDEPEPRINLLCTWYPPTDDASHCLSADAKKKVTAEATKTYAVNATKTFTADAASDLTCGIASNSNDGVTAPVMNDATGACGYFRVVLIPRRAHRPTFYGTAPDQLLLSPASVDLSGVVISPSPADFHSKLTSAHLQSLILQTTYPH